MKIDSKMGRRDTATPLLPPAPLPLLSPSFRMVYPEKEIALLRLVFTWETCEDGDLEPQREL